MLNGLMLGDVWMQTHQHEVDVLWQPTDGEYYDYQDHHLHNLM